MFCFLSKTFVSAVELQLKGYFRPWRQLSSVSLTISFVNKKTLQTTLWGLSKADDFSQRGLSTRVPSALLCEDPSQSHKEIIY